MKKIIVALAVMVMLPSFGMAMDQGWDRGPGMGMHHGAYQHCDRLAGPGLWAALNLSSEQSQKLKDLRASLVRESIPLRNEIRSKRFELRALWMQTNPDEGKILAKQKEMNALRSDLQEKVTKGRLEMRRVMTPEQQAQLTYFRSRSRAGTDHCTGCRFRGPSRGHHRIMMKALGWVTDIDGNW